MTGFYHVCFTVPELEAAMRDLTAAAGVRWSDPVASSIGDCDYRIVFTRGGPPFIELIQAAPGGPWGDTGAAGFHHLGWWTSDIAAGTDRLAAAGLPQAFTGCPLGRPFAYHRLDSIGAHVELVEAGRQPGFIDTWNPGGRPMPAIDEEAHPWNQSH
ncbi:VOC family protein [Streptomyces hainanensis]|uniref:VOC family protein n=1 Tax=Streptomyces hainanensis TaxID=402648 RepID=A0A4R4T5G6_9ACTN|nr:VOC family protein [Streptomyces hainanensis]TDC72160.1 VOC family protein [Streptomyces hainanensis]